MMRGIEQYLQVDAATLGALKYAGTWNASTNTPTLTSGVGTQGQYYVVSVAGSTNLDGETNWQVGDWAVFNGSVWQKVDGGSTGLLSTLTVTGNTYLATTSGNVGVGATSVTAIYGKTLQIGSGSTESSFSLLGLTGNGFVATNGATFGVFGRGGMALVLGTNDVERARIDTSGNVGIGTSSPGYKLTVAGTSGSAVVSLLETGVRSWGIRAGGVTTNTFDIADFTAGVSRLTLDASGNVGIGTSSPDAKLRVNGTAKIGEGAASNTSKLMVNTVSGVAAGIQLFQDANESWIIQNPASTTALTFANSGTERMRITSTGDVGIGTSSPAAKLDVVGSLGIRVNEDAAGTKVIQIRSNFAGLGPSIQVSTADPLLFLTSNTERMRIDSTGNVGIGTSSPSVPLTVGSSNARILVQPSIGTNGAWTQFNNTGGNAYVGIDSSAGSLNAAYALNIYHAGAYPIVFSTSNTERMRLDASGNLGLGVTPSAWAGYKPLQAGTGASFGGYAGDVLSFVGSNTYNDNTNWRYIVSGNAAARYQQSAGVHAWYNAPSGTAGNAISFTQAMTLDASGSLLVGKTSASVGTDGAQFLTTGFSGVSAAGTTAFFLNRNTSDGTILEFGRNGVSAATMGITSSALTIGTGGSERMRITSAGNIHTPAGATTMTNGFFYIPAAAGVPTGVPTAITGTVPMYYDTTNNKFYVYNGAWKSVALL